MNEKQSKIISMFNDIAPTYDTANRILSFGTDISWRKLACRKSLELSNSDSLIIVDMATGTGDMLIFWQKIADKMKKAIKQKIGVDPAENMLALAKQKVHDAQFKIGMAQLIPLDTASSDIVSISYGFRNVVEKEAGVREFARVLKSGGLFCMLEFTKDESKSPLNKLAQWYVRKILPVLGGLISGNMSAYKYLPDSIDSFLTRREIEELLCANGFSLEYSKDFSFGISSLVIARKI